MRKARWITPFGVMGLALAAMVGQAADPTEPTEPSVMPAQQIEVQSMPVDVKSSEYWIGVLCRPALPKEVRAHVDLPDKQGLLIDEVVPEGPAAKAGLQPMDILVSAGGKPIAAIADLVQAVEDSKGKELSVEVFRQGKSQTLAVVPEKRPADFKAKKYPAVPEHPELGRIYQWFDRVHPGWKGRPPMRLRFFHPGMILPPDAPMHAALPDSMTVTISKQGSELARITVKKGDQQWEVSEKELDQLPKDVRPHVDRMLEGMVFGPHGAAPRFDFVPDWTTPGKPSPPSDEDGGLKQRLEQRLDKMNQRMERLQQMMEQLRDKTGPEEKK